MPSSHVPAPFSSAPLTVLVRRLFLSLACALAWASAHAREADYPQLAGDLRQRLSGITAPTPALTALARKLASGRADPRTRALALSDWVRIHIRHDEPMVRTRTAALRPAAAVLERGHGDALEAAVLLQALLAADGIDATLALARRGPDYDVPDPPTLQQFDAALVYLPGFGLYLAPDEHDVAAGYLPQALLGKPALLVNRGSFAMTPLNQPDSIRSMVTVELRRDGSAGVRLERTYGGAAAEPVRTAMRGLVRDAPAAARAQMAPRFLQQFGQHGRGTLTTGALDAGGDFRMRLSGMSQRVAAPDTPSLATDYARLGMIAGAVAGLRRIGSDSRDASCPGADLDDELRYRLPPGLRVMALPAAVNVVQGGLFYRADYERQGDMVAVKRRLTFRSGRPSCSAADAADMAPALARIEHDLRSRISVTQP